MASTNRSSRRSIVATLSDSQTRYVLSQLLVNRRISARDIEAHLKGLAGEIAELEERLRFLRPAADGRSPRSSAVSSGAGRRRTAKRTQRLSNERRKALVTQGQYMALVRRLPQARKARFKAIFKREGGAAAVAALRKVLGTS